MPISKIDNNSFEEEVLLSDQLTFVHFYTDWAGSCHILKRVLEELEEEENEFVKITMVNVDDNRAFAKVLDIKSVPTISIYKDGKLLETLSGAQPKHILKDKILRYAD